VYLRAGVCYLEDLGSKNGTFYSGEQVNEPVRLSDGDILQIALIQKFAFYSSDATMPIEDLNPALLKSSGSLVMDPKSRRVWVRGQELLPPLSAAQFRLLFCLYEQTGKVVSRDELIEKTWESEESSGVTDQALDALIRRLRDRLHDLDDEHQYIVTVRGHGTRLENPPFRLQ
jgi:DNA-binding winged helix-turn-helix (wHTH) protein